MDSPYVFAQRVKYRLDYHCHITWAIIDDTHQYFEQRVSPNVFIIGDPIAFPVSWLLEWLKISTLVKTSTTCYNQTNGQVRTGEGVVEVEEQEEDDNSTNNIQGDQLFFRRQEIGLPTHNNSNNGRRGRSGVYITIIIK